MALKDLVQRCKETAGLNYQRNLAILRNYINTMLTEDLIKEIYQLETIEDIQILWSAGLRKTLQDAALTRYDQIREGRR